MDRTVSGQLAGMILGVSLGGFRPVLLRVHMVRVRQLGAVASLLMVAGVVVFGCKAVVARGLIVVLCRCFMVLCSCYGNGKIRRFSAVRIGNHP